MSREFVDYNNLSLYSELSKNLFASKENVEEFKQNTDDYILNFDYTILSFDTTEIVE